MYLLPVLDTNTTDATHLLILPLKPGGELIVVNVAIGIAIDTLEQGVVLIVSHLEPKMRKTTPELNDVNGTRLQSQAICQRDARKIKVW